ncbi:MAG: Appr-1-p processing protein [Spirochaetes bacterium GWF1_31_7]|nr:MAG: Appr-1-p processing protein [Spirochaetes bacterium GWE1_32_154]OHD46637.1 MAG: Appr-1-p processing protein [Spirochaetes bacterium GWF1_31_7]OHD76791.1 MAG: Appr-1-p processing protein [Spirochaetes bacterium RIFOXYB1_FULL_32_8]HBI36004.1 Appr-1-p processing protein [Spirochaetia bacterium]
MITYKTGDLLLDDAQALVNTVNCVGVMGRGIALQFKKRFPDNFKFYEKACKQEAVIPGNMFVYETGNVTNPRIIINFPTKRHWRGASRLEDIEAGLENLADVIKKYNIKSIALPSLGCGLGGLDWNIVKPIIENYLSNIPSVDVRVFEPQGAPVSEKMVKNHIAPQMTPGRAALVELVYRYLSGLLDPFITLLEIHKLMYFLQESGENLRLKYTKAAYGPYAENLRHVLNSIEGHLLSGYADGGDKPDKQLTLVPGAYEDASKFLKDHQQTNEHFNRVSNLVEGFESPFGMELLATVHWVVTKEKVHGIDEIVDCVYSWNERKKQFNKRQIELAYSVLCEKGWIQCNETS